VATFIAAPAYCLITNHQKQKISLRKSEPKLTHGGRNPPEAATDSGELRHAKGKLLTVIIKEIGKTSLAEQGRPVPFGRITTTDGLS
jgi:hypothetical protein